MNNFTNAYALTGGLATGKSSTAKILQMYGFLVVDFDALSSESFAQNLPEIKALFNTTDKKQIANIVFNNKSELEKLESLLHPIITQKAVDLTRKQESLNVAYFLDIPLFFEKLSFKLRSSVLVYAPKDLQIKRALNRGMAKEDIQARLKNQLDIEQKKRLADYVIDNSGDINQLAKEVDKFVRSIQ